MQTHSPIPLGQIDRSFAKAATRIDSADDSLKMDLVERRKAYFWRVYDDYLADCRSGRSTDWMGYMNEAEAEKLAKAVAIGSDSATAVARARAALEAAYARGAMATAERATENTYGL